MDSQRIRKLWKDDKDPQKLYVKITFNESSLTLSEKPNVYNPVRKPWSGDYGLEDFIADGILVSGRSSNKTRGDKAAFLALVHADVAAEAEAKAAAAAAAKTEEETKPTATSGKDEISKNTSE